MSVLVQAGHSQRFTPYLPGGGGAPGEANWASDLAELLLARLTAAGVDVTLVGAWLVNGVEVAPPPEVEADYDLFLSLHYDAAVYPVNTGGFADRAALDPMGAASDRFIALWEARYPAATGIPLHNERRNPNTWNYYAFRDTTANTPGVLIEHGVGMGLDHDTLYGQIDLIAETDAACVLAFLGITHPEDDDMAKLTADQQAILTKMAALSANSASIDGWINEIGALGEENNQLRDEVRGLTDQLAHIPTVARKVTKVAVTFDDGASQEVPAA